MKKNLTLTQRAILTFASGSIIQIAEFLTGFFITPIIIRGLGAELYGAWGMLQQTNGYFSTSDLRAPAAMRFLLGLKQHDQDVSAKQRLVGALFIVWAITLPITALLGAVLVWYAPQIVQIEATQHSAIRIALIVLITNSILDRILSVPLHILRAQNLDYVGVGVNTFTVFAGSILSGLAVWMGWGLVGLAIATTTNIIIVSLGRFWVARRAIPWLGAKRPTRVELIQFIKTSLWLFLAGLSGLLVYATDTILVGIILNPAASGIYITTGLVMRMFGEPMYQVISAGNAGLMGLCGQQDWKRVAQVRKEMYFILFFSMTILGTGVIALNGQFLSLWTGDGFFGGSTLTILIVFALLTMYLSRIDLLITDAMLFLRQKTWIFLAAGLVVVGGGVSLLPRFGNAGMSLAVFAGNLVLLSASWWLIYQRMGTRGTHLLLELIRPLTVMLVCFGLAAWLQSRLPVNSWVQLFLLAGLIGSSTLLAAFFIGMPSEIRASLRSRLQYNLRRKGS